MGASPLQTEIVQRLARAAAVAAAAASLAACASVGGRYEPAPRTPGKSYTNEDGQKVGRPYEVNGRWYTPREQPHYDEVGTASWYGYQHEGKPTANGEVFHKDMVSAAHKTLPLPSLVEVTNLANGKKLKVRVNDRGPFVDGRIIDLSQEAARRLGFEGQGVTKVRVRYIGVRKAQRDDDDTPQVAIRGDLPPF
jgi:rare lipoprotein A